MIEFDAATHTYRVAGRVTPNVTRILEDAGITVIIAAAGEVA